MKKVLTYTALFAALAALAVGVGCRRGQDLSKMPPVVVALGTSFDPASAPKQFEPLRNYLQERFRKPFVFQPCKTREEFAALVKEGKATFAFANPLDYAEVAEGCIVLVKANYVGSGSLTQGGLIVKEGEAVKIRDVAAMKGATIMVVSKTSLDGYLSQKMFFARNGLDIDLDLKLSEAPNHKPEEVMAAVAAGEVEYGCVPVDLYPGRKPVRGTELLTMCEKVPVEVFAYVEMAGDKMFAGQVRDALKKIPKNDPVLKPLGIESFVLATQAEYDNITNFIAQDKIDKAQRLSSAPPAPAATK